MQYYGEGGLYFGPGPFWKHQVTVYFQKASFPPIFISFCLRWLHSQELSPWMFIFQRYSKIYISKQRKDVGFLSEGIQGAYLSSIRNLGPLLLNPPSLVFLPVGSLFFLCHGCFQYLQCPEINKKVPAVGEEALSH